MSFLTTVAKINTANQLTAWNTSCVQAMQQAKQTFSSIYAQRVAMETNTDYTADDLAEVDKLLMELNRLAKELIAPVVTPEASVEPVVPTI